MSLMLLYSDNHVLLIYTQIPYRPISVLDNILYIYIMGSHEVVGSLNQDKSEVVCDDSSTKSAMLRAVPGLSMTERDHVTLLGSPIGTASGIQNTILKRTKSLQTLGSRLQLLRAHDAFCLLRNALAITKVLYILHTSPCFLVPALHDFDSLLRSLLGTILNVNLSDSAWTRASLPV